MSKFLTRLASRDGVAAAGWAQRLRKLLHRHGLFERDDVEQGPAAVELSGRFCVVPFETAEVHSNGNIHLCCEAWLPRPAGNMHRNAPAKIWNSRAARQIRQSIHDGDFRYCDASICPKIAVGLPTKAEASEDPRIREIIEKQQVELEHPKWISLVNDRSCNLSCPSCRKSVINHSSGDPLVRVQNLQEKIVEAYFGVPHDQDFTINITGSGDPFASVTYRKFLFDLDGSDFPNVKVDLQTNGTLLNQRTWEKMHKIHEQIQRIVVSLDAATEATYNITRRGGNWNAVLKNIRHLAERRRNGEFLLLQLHFVAQHANYGEIADFVTLGLELDVDQIVFQRAINWWTWTEEEFAEVSVWRPEHPEHDAFMKVMTDPRLDDERVSLGNLTPLRREALARFSGTEPSEPSAEVHIEGEE